jgi:hypothetical protein
MFLCKYCEYNPSYDQCKEWWKDNHPDEYEDMIAQGTLLFYNNGSFQKYPYLPHRGN